VGARPLPTLHLSGLHVTDVDEKLLQNGLPVDEGGTADRAGKLNALRVGDLVEDRDGRPIAQEDPLGVDGYRISHVFSLAMPTGDIVENVLR